MSPPKRRTTGSTPSNVAVPRPATNQGYAPPTILAARRRPWWSRLGWPLAILGLIVFVVGWVGAQTGAIAVPGDRHHVLSQVVGFGLVFVGIRLGSGRGDRH